MNKTNYKRIGLLLVAASAVVLAGCGNSAKDMTFNDVYNGFRGSHTNEAVELMNGLAQAPALAEKGHYAISGSVSGGIAANIGIAATSTVSNEGMNTDSALAISGTLTQPGMDDTITLDSNILFKMVSGLSYINLSSLSLNSAKGNPQISMIGAFSAILTNKRISLASSGMDTSSISSLNLSNLYTLPAAIVTSLQNHPIFTETNKEMVDGNPVYHVALDASGLYLVAKEVVANEAVQSFLGATELTDADLMNRAQTFVANSQFQGKLTAYSRDNIVLTIDRLRLDEVESLRGEIAKEKSHLEVVDSANGGEEVVATIDIEEKGDVTEFVIAAPKQELHLNGSVDINKASANGVGYALMLFASHPSINLSVNGNVDVEKTDAVTIEAPSSFQTIDQLVGGFRDLVGSGAESSPLMQGMEDDMLIQ